MIRIDGRRFVDDEGRSVILRGVNLGGSTKLPYDRATHIPSDFSDHRDVSFVNRPFPLEEADEHFSRLKHWGFNTLRLLTTWEAVEHEGPKKYDTKYLDYITKISKIASDYGFYIFLDPHQDVWSRMTGGDGAPGWTLESIGLDISKLSSSDAALTMEYHYPRAYPPMRWAFNYYYLGAATMFTLFFAGNDLAPNTFVEGMPVQDYLQKHFIDAMTEVTRRICDNPGVIGHGALNEPGKGYIGIDDISQPYESIILGKAPTPFQTMVAGDGNRVDVPYYDIQLVRIRNTGLVPFNEDAESVWRDGCIWRKEGIWEYRGDKPVLMKPHHFRGGVFTDYLRDFSANYINQIREIHGDSILFLEGEPIVGDGFSWGASDPKNVVNASHWYDAVTLVTKKFRSFYTLDIDNNRPVIGPRAIKRLFRKQLHSHIDQSNSIHGGIPTLIGEFGIPYDVHGKRAYRTGKFNRQEKALSLYYDLIDELQLHSTLWNYTADNNNEFGDLWNLEDLSIFSRDQQDDKQDINSGGRAIGGFCRPYPMKIPAKRFKFSFRKGKFHLQFDSSKLTSNIEIYIPDIHFPNGIKCNIDEYDLNSQILTIDPSKLPQKDGNKELFVDKQ